MTVEAQIAKCLSVYRAHPNTKGLPTGALKTWLEKALKDGDFRKRVNETEGNLLADLICSHVERISAKEGKPWKRVPPEASAGTGGE